MLLVIATFLAITFIGAVHLSPGEVWSAIWGGGNEAGYVSTIVWETRIPMGIAALCCGALLSAAGLMMQTLFQNPLAGPSVLGVSSGASFGVAVVMLGASAFTAVGPGWQSAATVSGALAGGFLTILILLAFSSVMRSGVTLLIVGLMLSYLCASGISLLNYFSPADEIRNYLVWGLGSFTGLRLSSSLWLLAFTLAAAFPVILFVKPLNAMLMGERYMESVGYSVKRIRGLMLLYTGVLVAVPTAFCGPIGFIGLVVPHLCRLIFHSSNHLLLLPAVLIYGAGVSLLCAFIGVLPAGFFGVLPINVITPIIGVPVILYLLLNRKRIVYFQ